MAPGAAACKVPCGCPGHLVLCSWTCHHPPAEEAEVCWRVQPGSTALWHCVADLASIYRFAGSKKLQVTIISHPLSAPLSLPLGKAFSSACLALADCSLIYLYIYFCQNFAILGRQSWLMMLEHSWPRHSPP